MTAVPLPLKTTAPRLTRAAIFARAIRLDVEIGIYGHEFGRVQPLVIDVEVEMVAGVSGFEHIADTVNYEAVVAHARRIAADGHLKLVETFAERLAHACLADPLARKVRVRIEKPEALAPHAEAAGVELVLER